MTTIYYGAGDPVIIIKNEVNDNSEKSIVVPVDGTSITKTSIIYASGLPSNQLVGRKFLWNPQIEIWTTESMYTGHTSTNHQMSENGESIQLYPYIFSNSVVAGEGIQITMEAADFIAAELDEEYL